MHKRFLIKNKIYILKTINSMLQLRIFPHVKVIIKAKWVLIWDKVSLLHPLSLAHYSLAQLVH